MNRLPTLEAMLDRYRLACNLRQTVDPTQMTTALTTWLHHMTGAVFTARLASSLGELFAVGEEAGADDSLNLRYHDDLEAGSRAYGRTPSAQKARGIWETCAEWLKGEWPLGTWEIAVWCLRAFGAYDTGDAAFFQHWEPLLRAFEAGALLFSISPTYEALIVPIPTTLRTDEQGRLHCADGPSYVLLDYHEYYWHGVHVPPYVITHPETITQAHIERETYPPLQQVLTERFYAVQNQRPPE